MGGHINMCNYNICNVNTILFNDPGPSEGLTWSGGNTKIFESPDNLTTNSAGNLQMVYGSTRRLTVNNTGIDVNGNIVVSGTVDGRDVAADGSKLDGIACGATANTGDITQVVAGTNLTGGGTSGCVTINMATGGPGAGVYGSSSNGCKIDCITLDAYGRVTSVDSGPTGTVTSIGISPGTGLDAGNAITSSGTISVTLDLSELTDMTGGICTTQDELILLDNGAERRKLFSEIFGCNAYSNTAFTTCTGTTTPSNSQTFTNKGGCISQWTNNSGYTTCTGTTTNSNTQTFTNKSGCISQWTNNSGYTTCTGNVATTGATFTGTINSRDIQLGSGYHLMRSNHESGHLEGGHNNIGSTATRTSPIYTIGSSYNPASTTLGNMYGVGFTNGNSSSFINMTCATGWGMYVAADGDARVFLDGSNGTISSIGQHYVGSSKVFHDTYHPNADTLTTARTIAGVSFNGSANISLNNNAITNGAGYTTCTGDITGVTAGDGISGGGTSGGVSVAVDSTVIRTTGSQSLGGTKTFTSGALFNDSVCAEFGNSSDLVLYHNGTSSFIDNDKNHLCIRNNVDGDDGGNIYIMPHDNETGIVVHDDGAVCLYSDNAVKLCTQSYGAKTQGTHCASYDMKAPIGCFCTMGIGGQSRQSSYALVAGNCGSCCGGGSAKFCGCVSVCGSFSKSSGCFDIAHPLPALSATKRLSHSFVESPQADNIYSGVVDLTAGKATVNIDEIHGMTNGTLTALNRCFRTFTTNETNWDPVRGSVTGNTLTVESCVADSTATVSWMVLGERHDPHMREISTTDDEGRARVEYTPPSDIYSDGDWEEL
mgnify:CR=1 FL=1